MDSARKDDGEGERLEKSFGVMGLGVMKIEESRGFLVLLVKLCQGRL